MDTLAKTLGNPLVMRGYYNLGGFILPAWSA
jgi:hypothetical protein